MNTIYNIQYHVGSAKTLAKFVTYSPNRDEVNQWEAGDSKHIEGKLTKMFFKTLFMSAHQNRTLVRLELKGVTLPAMYYHWSSIWVSVAVHGISQHND